MNTPLQKDDPRITHYALNDMTLLSADDITQIETAIANDPLIQEEIDFVRSSAQAIGDIFTDSPSQTLDAASQKNILGQRTGKKAALSMALALGGSLAAAAVLLSVLPITQATQNSSEDLSTTLAQHNTATDPASRLHKKRTGSQGNTSVRDIDEIQIEEIVEQALTDEQAPLSPSVKDIPLIDDLHIEIELPGKSPEKITTEPKGREQAIAHKPPTADKAWGNHREKKEKHTSSPPRSRLPARKFIGGLDSDGGEIYTPTHKKEHSHAAPRQESDNYNTIQHNEFKDLRIKGNDFSTFSIDVDTASYSDMRAQIQQYGRLPQANAIRIEEFINYFDYQYNAPQNDSQHPFAYHIESTQSPWNAQHRLLRIGIQGKRIAKADRPASNLVFLIDTSGSMSNRNKLPLLKESFRLLVQELDERDSVAIVSYAGNAGVVLPATSGHHKQKIISALKRLRSGGSTNGVGGIRQAYAIAKENFNIDAENRVILATDGDFNVGINDQKTLVNFIKQQASSGIFLNIHGYGMSNRKDGRMEAMSNNGNGSYAYIDNIREAQKVMVDDLTGSLYTIAKDVKIQCVFNPQYVAAWRLIGYSNRILATEDFKNDKIDAGEIGAGHNVTALYEIIPVGTQVPSADIDPNPFVKNGTKKTTVATPQDSKQSPAWLQLRLRYKQPQESKSIAQSEDIIIHNTTFSSASESMRWASSVASFAMLLRKSPYIDNSTWDKIIQSAKASRGSDPHGHRAECIRLMEMARNMQP